MSNMLSEISRVREIMGVINEQDIITTTVTAPSEEMLEYIQDWIVYCETGKYADKDEIDPDWAEGQCDDLNGTTLETLKTDPVTALKEMLAFHVDETQEHINLNMASRKQHNQYAKEIAALSPELTTLLATLSEKKELNRVTNSDGSITVSYVDGTIEVIPPKNPQQIAAAVPIKGCTDEDAPNYDPKATIDDGSCKEHSDKTPKKSIKKLKRGLKDKWKKEVFKILKGIKEGDIFGFDKVYDLQESDKLHALLTMLQNLMCVNAKIARTVILAQDNVYDPTKLMTIAQFPKGGGHEGLIETIFTNMELLDKQFKLGGGGMKVDRRLRPIKSQLNRAKDFINTIEPYLNWGGVEDSLGFRATSTEDILINSNNLNQIHRDCANQIK